MSNHSFLEYVLVSNDSSYKVFGLQIFYQHQQPFCITNHSYGFLQEIRFEIDLEKPLSTMQAPIYFSNVIAYSPLYIANFELGEFMYPILLRPYIFRANYYDHYLQLYYFYRVDSLCNPPCYYLNIPFHYVMTENNEEKDIYMILIYRHSIIPGVPPIDYCWSLYKIIVPISSNKSCIQIKTHNKLKDIIFKIVNNQLEFQTMSLSTRELIPEALWFHFCTHHSYSYGYNYALNGNTPSNNSLVNVIPCCNSQYSM